MLETLLSVFQSQTPTPLQEIHDPLFDKRGVAVYIKREDLIHPVISGNKWHKLKYNLSYAVNHGYDTVLSFGGAYSNHIHALAYAGKQAGVQTIGVIRGEPHQPLNSTLQFASDQGMQLHYIPRAAYRHKDTPEYIHELQQRFGACYIVPEGGSNALAVLGCSDIVKEVTLPFDVICCACGTGGTLAGLISGLNEGQRAIGFAALAAGDYLSSQVQTLLTQSNVASTNNWYIENNYHFGGYAKVTPMLLDFMARFESHHHIELEPIYTAKMLYGIFDLIEKGYFARGSTLVALHSGGLQGRESLLSKRSVAY